jgi:hypothetical protein
MQNVLLIRLQLDNSTNAAERRNTQTVKWPVLGYDHGIKVEVKSREWHARSI